MDVAIKLNRQLHDMEKDIGAKDGKVGRKPAARHKQCDQALAHSGRNP
jgi:hypothetical protein